MRLTKAHLKQLIKEELSESPRAVKIKEVIIGTLSGMLKSESELAASVGAELAGLNVTEDEISTVLSEMLEDGTAIFDAEMDEWSLS
jgi:hypothetical protein